MRTLGRLSEIPITAARSAAIVRVAVVLAVVVADQAEKPDVLREKMLNVVLVIAAVWAMAMCASSFGGRRREIRRGETAIDLALLGAIVYASGGPLSDARRAFFVFPVLAAATQTARTTAVVAVTTMLVFTLSSLLGGWGEVDSVIASTAASDIYLLVVVVASILTAILLDAQKRGLLLEVERNRLLSQQLLEVRDAERQELAQWLHDEPVQLLVASRMELEAVRTGTHGAAGRLEDRIELAERNLRDAAFELSPYALEELGLCEAIRQVAEEASAQTSMELEMDCESLPSHSDDRSYFAIARELISNAARHSRGSTLEVVVEADGGGVRLVVKDDGVGIDRERRLDALKEGHLGLVATRERAAAIGAELSIETPARGGTRITVRPAADELTT